MTKQVLSKSKKNAGRIILLVNTGSVMKKFILQKLSRMGVKIIALNKEKNWAESYVDKWILADTTKHAEATRAVQSFIEDHPKCKIEGVIKFWEDDVLLTSKIADKFGFIGIPYAVSSHIRNKFFFRNFCEKNGIMSPKYKAIESEQDLDYVRDNFIFPIVIKPAYGSSSAFVVKVEGAEELQEIYEYVKPE